MGRKAEKPKGNPYRISVIQKDKPLVHQGVSYQSFRVEYITPAGTIQNMRMIGTRQEVIEKFAATLEELNKNPLGTHPDSYGQTFKL